MLKLINAYRLNSSLENARKLRAYERAHPMAACALTRDEGELLNHAILLAILGEVTGVDDRCRPNKLFSFIRADEVAECWEGVGQELYYTLWNKIVPLQKAIPNIEDSGPADHIGHENLAAHWHLLSLADQIELNALAAAQEG